MRPDDYQHAARSTAMYPEGRRLSYPVLGLAGELGELLDALAQTPDDREQVTAELGDVCWYVANLACDLQLDLEELPVSDTTGGAHPFVALSVTVGKIAEKVKKTVRDTDGALTPERHADLEQLLGQLWGQLATVADNYGNGFDAALAHNVAKLASRKQRGVLSGDGDHR